MCALKNHEILEIFTRQRLFKFDLLKSSVVDQLKKTNHQSHNGCLVKLANENIPTV